MKFIRNSRGFTLLEIMMVVSILSIFIAIIYNYMDFNFRFLNDRNDEHDSYLEARVAMGRVKQLLLSYNYLDIVDDPVSPDYGIVTGERAVDDPNEDTNLTTDKLINFNKNTTEMTDYRYYFFCPVCVSLGSPCTNSEHIGQLKSGGNVVVEGVKVFDISKSDGVLNITIHVVANNDPDDPGLTLTSSIRSDRRVITD